MQHKLSIQNYQLALNRYQERLNKLNNLTTEQLRQYTVKEYCYTKAYLQSRIKKYQALIDTHNALPIKVNGLQTV